MLRILTACWVCCGLVWGCRLQAAEPAAGKPKIAVSKETTYFTEPLYPDGNVNYMLALNQHFGREVQPEHNAAAILYEIIGPKPDGSELSDEFYATLGISRPAADAPHFVAFERWQQQLPVDERQAINRDHIEMKVWTKAEFPQVAKWLEEMEPILQRTVEASQRQQYFIPLSHSRANAGKRRPLMECLLPGLSVTRELTRTLVIRANYKLGKGDVLDAWRDLVACQRIGRLMSHSATAIEGLVAIAIEHKALDGQMRVLISSKNIRRFVPALRKLSDSLPPRITMTEKVDVAERCMFLDAIAMMAEGQMDWSDFGIENAPLKQLVTGALLRSVDWNIVAKRGNDSYSRVTKLFEIQDRLQRYNELLKFEDEWRKKGEKLADPKHLLTQLAEGSFVTVLVSDAIVGSLMPAMGNIAKGETRIEQKQIVLTTVFALSSHYGDQKRYPESLEALVPKYLPALPQDLFTGKPLTYRRTAEGYRLYSFGHNQQDDGGVLGDNGRDDLGVQDPLSP